MGWDRDSRSTKPDANYQACFNLLCGLQKDAFTKLIESRLIQVRSKSQTIRPVNVRNAFGEIAIRRMPGFMIEVTAADFRRLLYKFTVQSCDQF